MLTVHVGMQPEDAGVGVSKGSAQTAAALLPPLLLQPMTVRHARLLVHLEAPGKHKYRQELCKLSCEWTMPSFGPQLIPMAKNTV